MAPGRRPKPPRACSPPDPRTRLFAPSVIAVTPLPVALVATSTSPAARQADTCLRTGAGIAAAGGGVAAYVRKRQTVARRERSPRLPCFANQQTGQTRPRRPPP